jgi:addiction module RelE/StbE family toxin
MKIVFQKSFEKKFIKLPTKIKTKIKERNILFESDPYDPLINNHALSGKYTGYRSINVTGDIRIIYKLLKTDTALFVTIGTHSELYK